MNVILCAIAYRIIMCAVVHFHFFGCTNSQGTIRYQLGWLFSRRYQLGWQFNEEEDLGAILNLKIFDIGYEGRNDE